jgi:hypothetical protein
VALLQDRFHAQALFDPTAPALIASAAPAVSALASALVSTLMRSAALAVIVLLIRRWRRYWPAIVMLLVFAALPEDVRTPGEFALSYAAGLATAAAATFFCFRIARGNALAYALALWTMALRGPLTELFSLQPRARIARAGRDRGFDPGCIPRLRRRTEWSVHEIGGQVREGKSRLERRLQP